MNDILKIIRSAEARTKEASEALADVRRLRADVVETLNSYEKLKKENARLREKVGDAPTVAELMEENARLRERINILNETAAALVNKKV